MKVGDLIRINLALPGDSLCDYDQSWWAGRQGQLGVIIEINGGFVPGDQQQDAVVMLTDGTKEWFRRRHLEVVNESR